MFKKPTPNSSPNQSPEITGRRIGEELPPLRKAKSGGLNGKKTGLLGLLSKLKLSNGSKRFQLEKNEQFVSVVESEEEWKLPPRNEKYSFTVVLDLDETLLHSIVLEHDQEFAITENIDFQFVIGPWRYIVTLRPRLDAFLKWASGVFELIVYTAGSDEYAKEISRRVDPEGKYFSHILSRKHCIKNPHSEGIQKDLSILNRSLDRLVLVDNSAHR